MDPIRYSTNSILLQHPVFYGLNPTDICSPEGLVKSVVVPTHSECHITSEWCIHRQSASGMHHENALYTF